jgi:lysine N6-hydroxylase
LPAQRRRDLVALQRYASDGVSEDLLRQIYRRLYELDFVEDVAFGHRLLPGHELVDIAEVAGARQVALRSADTGAVEVVDADVVILATGYEATLPECVSTVVPAIGVPPDDGLDEHYRLAWDGAPQHAIYIQNGGRLSHGVADANLSLTCWRAATILNAVCGRRVVRTDWGTACLAAPAPASAATRAPVEVLP